MDTHILRETVCRKHSVGQGGEVQEQGFGCVVSRTFGTYWQEVCRRAVWEGVRIKSVKVKVRQKS